MKKQQMLAVAIMAALAVWIFVPRSATIIDNNTQRSNQVAITAVAGDAEAGNEIPGMIVRVKRSTAQNYQENIRVRGRTQAFRKVDVRAEQAGRVASAPVLRGARVKSNDVLCEIAIDTRDVDLVEAESRREQTRFEYDATLDLQKQGLQSAVAVAQAKAAFDASTAAVERSKLALKNTKIRAPFDGVVETRDVEEGDLLDRGGVCATVLDDSPMLLVGMVPEQEIGELSIGALVNATLLTNEKVSGVVTYLSRAADPQSRSYRIEAEINQSSHNLRDGITAEILIAAAEVQAHLIPASSLTLDDNGEIGVKVLDSKNTVGFVRVAIVGEEAAQLDSGLWVTGLSEQVTLITLGQENVFSGQRVEGNFDQ